MNFTKLDRQLFDEIFSEEPTADRVRSLVKKGANPNAIDPEGLNTVLMEAVELLEDDEVDIIKVLIELGANPNLESDELNPLVLAIYDQRFLFVQTLLKCGAKADFALSDGQTVRQAAQEFLDEIREEGLDDKDLLKVLALLG